MFCFDLNNTNHLSPNRKEAMNPSRLCAVSTNDAQACTIQDRTKRDSAKEIKRESWICEGWREVEGGRKMGEKDGERDTERWWRSGEG